MVAIEAAWKILGSSSRVISRVFVGGAGEERGGMEDRSMDNGDRERFCDNEGDEPAEFGGDARSRLDVRMGDSEWGLTSVMVAVDYSIDSMTSFNAEERCCYRKKTVRHFIGI